MLFLNIGLILCNFILLCENALIKFIYFDPSTTITSDLNDGVVIVELEDGTKSTLCMTNKYDNNNANVICKMMNYDGGTGYGVISSVKTSLAPTLYQNVGCTGTELSIENCANFVQGLNIFTCSNHNRDLHVKCTGQYIFNQTQMTIDNCNGKLSAVTEGFLSITQNTVTAYFCGINRNFGPTEATTICQKLVCAKTTYARIVEGYQSSSVRVIGGFNSMSCNGTTCINMYPYQSNRCTPDTNVAVICTNDTAVMYYSPMVSCNSSALTVSWNATIYNTTIANNFFAIQYMNGSNCTNKSVGPTVSDLVNLTVSFGTCDMIVMGTPTSISFIFRVIRMYPKVNNVIRNPDEMFNVSCVIDRNVTVVQGPLLVKPVALPPSSSNQTIPNTLTLWKDSNFKDQIVDVTTVAPGSQIFVLVRLVDPPPNIILVLNQCYYGSPPTNLILNRCAVLSNVYINTINDTAKSFNFLLTQSVNGGLLSQVTCLTSKCSTAETTCPKSC